MTLFTATIKAIRNIMRKDRGVNGDAQRIEQLVWMLFLKIFDDREYEIEMFDEDYDSPIPEELRWRNWAADAEGSTGDALLDFVNNDLIPGLRGLSVAEDDKRRALVRSVFEDATNYMKSGQQMREVINKLEGDIDFNSSGDRHVLGSVYEEMLRELQSAGDSGEFYTPRAVTRFMAEMCDPRPGERILDPACGTGGFLTCAIDHMREKYVKTTDDEERLQNSILGVEKKHLPHMLAVTNLFLHGIEIPSFIRRDNTLTRPLIDYGPKDRVDVVLTNPPFGGMERDGVENNFPAKFRTKETADLFLVFIMHVLKPGGRAAVVLPDGTLFGEGVKTRIKERLLEECDLHTVVRLPNGVFSPYTGIKTNLLFFAKGGPTRDIWFYEHPYPEGYKSYSKTKPIRIEEFEPEKAWWNDRRESERAWRVSAEAVKASGYNLDIRNPNAPVTEAGDANALFAAHREAKAEADALLEALRTELAAALGGGE